VAHRRPHARATLRPPRRRRRAQAPHQGVLRLLRRPPQARARARPEPLPRLVGPRGPRPLLLTREGLGYGPSLTTKRSSPPKPPTGPVPKSTGPVVSPVTTTLPWASKAATLANWTAGPP